MGMYTEINVCFDLTKGTPKNVVDVLYYLIDDNDKPSDLPNHEFFKCDRWDMVACCDSYYFDGMTNSKIMFDNNLYTLHTAAARLRFSRALLFLLGKAPK